MKKEEWRFLVGWEAISLLALWIFFPHPLALLAGAGLSFYWGRKQYARRSTQQAEEAINFHFERFLEAFSGSLNAGMNTLQAMKKSYQALFHFLPAQEAEKSEFLRAMADFFSRYEGGEGFSDSFLDFAHSLDCYFLSLYADQLVKGMKQGMDLNELTLFFYQLMLDQKELEEERKSKLYAAQMEQRLLFAMPVLILVMMKLTGLLSPHLSWVDWLCRIISVLLLALAWRWSSAILDQSPLGGERREGA